jgi:hypothetical protein
MTFDHLNGDVCDERFLIDLNETVISPLKYPDG